MGLIELCIVSLMLLYVVFLLGLAFVSPLIYCCDQTKPVECDWIIQSVCGYTGQPHGFLYALNVAATWLEDHTEIVVPDVLSWIKNGY